MPPPQPAELPTITLPMMSASELLNIEMPPPRAHGDSPDAVLPLMTLPWMVGVPAANSAIPPPSPLVMTWLEMTLPMILAAPAPTTWIPPPPVPPLQPCRTLRMIVLPWMSAELNLTEIPRPLHAVFSVITLFVIVGDADWMRTPPPSPNPGVLESDRPLRSVNPFNADPLPSPEVNVATESSAPPSMTVWLGPCVLATVMALPWKLMFSTYVPGPTITVSPFTATLIAAWIVG